MHNVLEPQGPLVKLLEYLVPQYRHQSYILHNYYFLICFIVKFIDRSQPQLLISQSNRFFLGKPNSFLIFKNSHFSNLLFIVIASISSCFIIMVDNFLLINSIFLLAFGLFFILVFDLLSFLSFLFLWGFLQRT